MFVSGQQYGAKGRAASMREAVYVLSTAVPPDPVAPWGGSWSHIVLLVHIVCYVARCRGSMRRERKDDMPVFWH